MDEINACNAGRSWDVLDDVCCPAEGEEIASVVREKDVEDLKGLLAELGAGFPGNKFGFRGVLREIWLKGR